MHSRFLVDVAAITASQNGAVINLASAAEDWRSDQFWVVSRARTNHWTARLKQIREWQKHRAKLDPRLFWAELEPVLEEVFLSEVSTRIWCATLAAVDHCLLPGELDPIARSVFVTCLEVRRQALRLLLFARGLPQVSTTSLNRLRFDCEVWTDQLLARIQPSSIATQFCFEKRRFRDLARAMRKLGKTRYAFQVWNVQLTGLLSSLATRRFLPPTSAELNAELCSLMMSCLPAQGFDATGILRPDWNVDVFQSDVYSLNVLHELCSEDVKARCSLPGSTRHR